MDANIDSSGKAMLHAKCPRCHKGDIFQHKWWHVTKFVKFYETCPECGLLYDREPGFFYGAMFVSYGLVVAMVLPTWLLLYFIFDPAFEVYLIVIAVLNILLLPLIFRYSRVLFLYGFGGVKYDKNYKKVAKD